MNKIAYVTKVSVFETAAQSIQIIKMGKAFYDELGENFFLVSGGDVKPNDNYHKVIYGNGSASILNIIRFSIAYLKFIYKEKPEWVFTRDIIVVLINTILFKKVCLELHHEYENRLSEFLFRVLKRSKKLKIIVISNALKFFLISKYNIDHRRIAVAHDACDGVYTPSNPFIFRDYSIPYYKKYIVHAGSFNKSRGANEFVTLARSYPEIGFIQIGGHQDEIVHWKESTKDLTNLRYIDQLTSSKLKALLASADLLFFPMNKNNKNWWCTSPMKIFDYLESGTPILGSCIGSTSEILLDGMFIEYNPEDTNDAKIKLAEAITNMPYWAKVAKKQSYFVRKNYTWKTRVSIIIDHLY